MDRKKFLKFLLFSSGVPLFTMLTMTYQHSVSLLENIFLAQDKSQVSHMYMLKYLSSQLNIRYSGYPICLSIPLYFDLNI
jgi:hypothetical protein